MSDVCHYKNSPAPCLQCIKLPSNILNAAGNLVQEVSYSIIMSCTSRDLVFFSLFIFYVTRLAASRHIRLYIDDPFSLDILFLLKF